MKRRISRHFIRVCTDCEDVILRTQASFSLNLAVYVLVTLKIWSLLFNLTAKTRSDRDFEMSLCYTPKAFSCLEEIKYNINHCLELAFFNVLLFHFEFVNLENLYLKYVCWKHNF